MVAEKICNLLELPYKLDGHTVNISPTIGIAVYPDDGVDVEHILTNAEGAMYSGKQSGQRVAFLAAG